MPCTPQCGFDGGVLHAGEVAAGCHRPGQVGHVPVHAAVDQARWSPRTHRSATRLARRWRSAPKALAWRTASACAALAVTDGDRAPAAASTASSRPPAASRGGRPRPPAARAGCLSMPDCPGSAAPAARRRAASRSRPRALHEAEHLGLVVSVSRSAEPRPAVGVADGGQHQVRARGGRSRTASAPGHRSGAARCGGTTRRGRRPTAGRRQRSGRAAGRPRPGQHRDADGHREGLGGVFVGRPEHGQAAVLGEHPPGRGPVASPAGGLRRDADPLRVSASDGPPPGRGRAASTDGRGKICPAGQVSPALADLPGHDLLPLRRAEAARQELDASRPRGHDQPGQPGQREHQQRAPRPSRRASGGEPRTAAGPGAGQRQPPACRRAVRRASGTRDRRRPRRRRLAAARPGPFPARIVTPEWYGLSGRTGCRERQAGRPRRPRPHRRTGQ